MTLFISNSCSCRARRCCLLFLTARPFCEVRLAQGSCCVPVVLYYQPLPQQFVSLSWCRMSAASNAVLLLLYQGWKSNHPYSSSCTFSAVFQTLCLSTCVLVLFDSLSGKSRGHTDARIPSFFPSFRGACLNYLVYKGVRRHPSSATADCASMRLLSCVVILSSH